MANVDDILNLSENKFIVKATDGENRTKKLKVNFTPQ